MPRGAVVAVLTALAFFLGPVLSVGLYGLFSLGLASGDPEFADFPYSESELMWRMILDVGVGVVAVVLLPFALRRAPESGVLDPGRDRSIHHLKEPTSALVVALIIGMLVATSAAAFPAWFIAVISISSRGIRRWIYWIPPVAVLSIVLSFVVTPSSSVFWEVALVFALYLAMTALPIVIGLLRWSRRRQIRALRSEAAFAQREAQAVIRAEQARAEKTRAEERTRIAREMHDTLSHRLALISTYAGALDYREDLDRETVRSTARLVQQTAATASAELRTVLDVLRDDPADTRPEPDLTQLDGLLAEVRATGVRVDSTVAGPAAGTLPDTTSRTLYRMLQEALTNAVKHAPGAPVRVEWGGDENTVELTVTNPLTGLDHPGQSLSSGFGLIGLEERAKALGGNVKTTKTATEFRLEASVPCRS